MPAPTDFGVLDEPADWIVCGSCRGERRVPDCLAGPDCPHEPTCRTRPCGTCGGDGGWESEVRSQSFDKGSGSEVR